MAYKYVPIQAYDNKYHTGLLAAFPFMRLTNKDAKIAVKKCCHSSELIACDPKEEALTKALRYFLKQRPQQFSWAKNIRYNDLCPYLDDIQYLAPPGAPKRYYMSSDPAIWAFLLDLHNDLVYEMIHNNRPELEDIVRIVLTNNAKRIPFRPSFMKTPNFVSKMLPSETYVELYGKSIWCHLLDNYAESGADIPWSSPKETSVGPSRKLATGESFTTDQVLYPNVKEGYLSAIRRKDYSVVKSGHFVNDPSLPRGVIHELDYLLKNADKEPTPANLSELLLAPEDPISKAASGERRTSQDGYKNEPGKFKREDLKHLYSKDRDMEELFEDSDGSMKIRISHGDNKKANETLSSMGYEGLGATDRRINGTDQHNQWPMQYLMHRCFHSLEAGASGFLGVEPTRVQRFVRAIEKFRSMGWRVAIIRGDGTNSEKWCGVHAHYLDNLFPPCVKRIKQGIKSKIIIAASDGLMMADEPLTSGDWSTTPENFLFNGCRVTYQYYLWVHGQTGVSEEEFTWRLNHHLMTATDVVIFGNKIGFCKTMNTDDIFDLVAWAPGVSPLSFDERWLEDNHFTIETTEKAEGFSLRVDLTRAPYVVADEARSGKQAVHPEGFGCAVKDYHARYNRGKQAGILDIIDRNEKKHFGVGVAAYAGADTAYPLMLQSMGASINDDYDQYSGEGRRYFEQMKLLALSERGGDLTLDDPMTGGVVIPSETKHALSERWDGYLQDDIAQYADYKLRMISKYQ